MEWNIKDGMLRFWKITATKLETEHKHGGYFVTIWLIRIVDDEDGPENLLTFEMETQYNLDPTLAEIWVALQEQMNTLTLAMLSAPNTSNSGARRIDE